MKIKNLVFFLFFIYFANPSIAQIIRPTTFDQRENCIEIGGVWRKFGDGCVDSCESQFSNFNFCSMALTFGCDCGQEACFYEDKCVSHQEYQQIYQEKIKIKELKLQKEEELRQAQRTQIVNEIIKKLIQRYNIPVDNQPADNQQGNNGNNISSSADNRQISANSNVASFYGAKNKNIMSDGNQNESEKIYYNKKPAIQDVQFSTVMVLDQPVPKSELENKKNGLVDIVDKSLEKSNLNDSNSKVQNSQNTSSIPAIFMQKIMDNRKKKQLVEENSQEVSDKQEENSQEVNDKPENDGKVKAGVEPIDDKKIIQILP